MGANPDVVDKQQRKPLHLAAAGGSHETVILLLGSKSSVNSKDAYGNTPISLAMKSHHFKLVNDLVLFGAPINSKNDNGMTCLHECCYNGDSKIFEFLLKQDNIKLNLKDQSSFTPFLRSIGKASIEFNYSMFTNKGN